MKKTAPADLQRWSEELASDPASLAFLPLARAYRRQDRHDAAMRLCLRGLEHHPDSTEAHGLLALLYVDRGDHGRAADEWSFVLRLDPSNFDALRGLGFCLLENGDLVRARNRLERAALVRPDDVAVREALRLVDERLQDEEAVPPAPDNAVAAPVAAAPAAIVDDEPWMQTPDPAQYAGERSYDVAASRSAGVAEPRAGVIGADPDRLFDGIVSGPIQGALLLDTRGMVLAGRIAQGADAAESLAAVLGTTTGEAARTADLLGLGAWRGLLLETGGALLHVARAGDDGVVLLVARPDAPAGWMMRSAAQAATIAQRFLEACA